MNIPPRMGLPGFVQLVLVMALAAVLRIGYLSAATDQGRAVPALAVQGDGPRPDLPAEAIFRGQRNPSTLDNLVHNLNNDRWFGAAAPLAEREEPTAHVAPGYPWLAAQLARFDPESDALLRWLQGALGVLTVGCLFLFVRRAFANTNVALVAGILAAIHPFWIINTGEICDGVVATFLLALALWLGTRGAQAGGAVTSFSFGLSLAALAMVRAALLPVATLGLLWFLYQCKQLRHGWFNAILAFLGFANGLAPWAVRNWSVFGEPVPIVTSAYLHVWIGNNPAATGGPLDDAALRKTVSPERLQELLAETNQAKRYARLGQDAWDEIQRNPAATVTRRWLAAFKFLTGDAWFTDQRMSRDLRERDGPAGLPPPEWLQGRVELLLQGYLLGLLILAFLGWRWSAAWRSNARLATFALLWLPLPYLLTHAEQLSGPRLPWDAALIAFAAYAFACLSPAVARSTEAE